MELGRYINTKENCLTTHFNTFKQEQLANKLQSPFSNAFQRNIVPYFYWQLKAYAPRSPIIDRSPPVQVMAEKVAIHYLDQWLPYSLTYLVSPNLDELNLTYLNSKEFAILIMSSAQWPQTHFDSILTAPFKVTSLQLHGY